MSRLEVREDENRPIRAQNVSLSMVHEVLEGSQLQRRKRRNHNGKLGN